LRTARRIIAALIVGILPILAAGQVWPEPKPVPVPTPALVVEHRRLPTPEARADVIPVGNAHLADAYRQAWTDGHDLEAVIEVDRISSYNPVPSQTDADPSNSSCGPTLPSQVALSQDLFFVDGWKAYCGSVATVYVQVGETVESYELVVNDTMAPRFRNTVDVMVHDTVREARQFGVRRGILILHADAGI